MRYKVGAVICVFGVTVSGCSVWTQYKKLNVTEYEAMVQGPIKNFDQVIQLFPKTVEQVQDYKRCAIEKANSDLAIIKHLPADQRSYANTVAAFDTAQDQFGMVAGVIRTLEMVSPDETLRTACHAAVLELSTFTVDAFVNKDLYRAFKEYVDGARAHETLSDEQAYLLDEAMHDFKRGGFALPDDQFEKVKTLNKKLGELELTFETNIANDKGFITVGREGLADLSDEFIGQLERDGDTYKVTCDYPVYNEVMNHCSVEATRKALYQAFNNRAHPVNKPVLEAIVAERDGLAHVLGFKSYAALGLDGLMAHTPERARTFITQLAQQARAKANKEYQTFAIQLPEGVTLVDGKFKPWDILFVKTVYKKKHFAIDDRQVAQYFEVDATLKAIFNIYQHFLGLKFFMTKPAWAWHDDVRLIEAYDAAGTTLRGYILLDLYPRPSKYSHACWAPCIPARKLRKDDGTYAYTPVVGIMIANFPKATPTKPALLKHSDVETFFHEFGHAMHSVLGATESAGASGCSVKRDFVEAPSQMFEEWMFDPAVLRSISCHYQTHTPLPDELIKKIIALKKFDSGSSVVRQCVFSLLSLDIFGQGGCPNIQHLMHKLHTTYLPMIMYDETNHIASSFGHLAGYGAAYYSYMWSKVYALDLFYTVKERGFNDPTVGKALVDCILSRGGGVDPDLLLKDFLGRAPNQKAFIADLGIAG
ncbi:MAG: M3 family metallopeptidase [Candidatus Babeliales bacterium]